MSNRLLGVLTASGILALIGYLTAPRRRKTGFSFNLNRLPFSMKNLTRMVKASRKMIRAAMR